jgi:uncharacterized membrane protein
MKFLSHYLITLVVFFAIDIVWLSLIAKKLYDKYLGYILSTNVNWLAAILFYLLFIVGLLVFVIEPALADHNMTQLIFRAALFGLITYATYDLTNLATLKDWPINITVIDLIWGTSVSTLVSVISYWIIGKL